MTATNLPPSPAFDLALYRAHQNPETNPQPLCDGREAEFVGYELPPSKEEARALCAPCPLLAICKESARLHEAPGWGIKGGIAWYEGKQWHWLEKFGLLPDLYDDEQALE